MLSITLWAKKLQISYHLLALKCRNRGESDSMKRWLVCLLLSDILGGIVIRQI